MLSCGIFQNSDALPTPTNTPALSPNPPPHTDFSGAGLTLQDLPPGFIEISISEFGITSEDLVLGSFTLNKLFFFLELENFEWVLGFTTDPLTNLQIVGFDVALQNPESLLEAVVTVLGGSGITEQQELSDTAL